MSQKSPIITPESFWHAVNILISKPHVVNRRLWGWKELYRCKCNAPNKTWENILSVKLQNPEHINAFIKELTNCDGTLITLDDSESTTELILAELLPRKYDMKHGFQLICLQREKMAVIFHDVTPPEHSQILCPDFTYKFSLENDNIVLFAGVDNTSKSYKWLMTTVLPQLNKWGLTEINNVPIKSSIALLPHDQYYEKYNVLKEIYAKELVKIWPESTDPSKFVYEDVAIATYLLLLWEEKQTESDKVTPQKFVDMGCGNGLLVFILTMEGHSGYGIDVRKRNIWNTYPSNIKLIEKTITPSNIDTITDVDWVIGNHSDELTPWIPVIAARSSYKCKFFLLPCCPFNFDGSKYQRQNSSKSQYKEYLEYIEKLCGDCGFVTDIDRLKIPSTRRICLIGKKRKHDEAEFNQYCENIDRLIKVPTCVKVENTVQTEITEENFKARETTEKVRNCTQIDKNVVKSIITCITKYLLEGCTLESKWSQGKIVDIKEIVSLLSSDMLKVLKSECGGLQTLLKNNSHIFRVQNGKIQLQYPKTVEEMSKTSEAKRFKSNIKLKSKPCWFHKNHPQGCPLQDIDCSFLH